MYTSIETRAVDFHSRGTGTCFNVVTLGDWGRPSEEVAQLAPAPRDAEPQRKSHDMQAEASSADTRTGEANTPTEVPPPEVGVYPAPDRMVLWMDRVASACRVIREGLLLGGLILPWIVGACSASRSSDSDT